MKKIFEDVPGLDGAHWGLNDLYDRHEKVLCDALLSGEPFDTGWYSSKKEIASARIKAEGGEITCEVSVSDDFDTPGVGEITLLRDDFLAEDLREAVGAAIYAAWDAANEDRKGNAVYAGYCIGHADHEGNRVDWVWTYIQPVGDGCDMDEPPGDEYEQWGFEYCGIGGEEDTLPPDVIEAIERWILSERTETKALIWPWVVEAWKDEDEEE